MHRGWPDLAFLLPITLDGHSVALVTSSLIKISQTVWHQLCGSGVHMGLAGPEYSGNWRVRMLTCYCWDLATPYNPQLPYVGILKASHLRQWIAPPHKCFTWSRCIITINTTDFGSVNKIRSEALLTCCWANPAQASTQLMLMLRAGQGDTNPCKILVVANSFQLCKHFFIL